MNAMQRYGLIAVAIALACLLVAHNPIAGYTTTFSRYEAWPLPSATPAQSELSCDPPGADQRDALTSQQRFLGEEIGHCQLVTLDIWEWRSNGALLGYLATVRKALAFAAAILLAGLAWLWLFRPPQPHELRKPVRRETTASSNPND